MKSLHSNLLAFFFSILAFADQSMAGTPGLPKEVRGFCIGVPSYDRLDDFIQFVQSELVPRRINVLVLRVDYRYQYRSHPELVATARRSNDSAQSVALSEAEMKRIVRVCKENKILLVPLVNLLGHQSWHSEPGALLKNYPQFDETPRVKFPEEYKWPNEDSLYCKSYCPLHPDVHRIVFDLVDEITDVCETDHFHAGMDEVFYLGSSQCPRCSGKDRSGLFANEVNLISAHLAARQKRLWIWGDRLIDAKETKLGIWEASDNDTWRSIDLINKNVVINDWHYVNTPNTAEVFARKGFDVMICPWNRPEVGRNHVVNYQSFKGYAKKKYSRHYKGVMQTVWSGPEPFIEMLKGKVENKGKGDVVGCFKAVFDRWDQ